MVTYVLESKDEFEFELLRLAIQKGIPIFGICRGLQMLNVYFGGNLYQDIPANTAARSDMSQAMEIRSQLTHRVDLSKERCCHRLMQNTEISVNSYHHLAIKTLGKGLMVSARAKDGIIEGIETADGRIYAVQWHPEELYAPHPSFRPLFDHFVALSAAIK